MVEQKLHKIIYKALKAKPDAVDFEFLEDSKSFWSQIVRATIHWPADNDEKAKDSVGRLIYPPSLFIKLPRVNTVASDVDHSNELENDLRVLWNTEVKFYEVFGNKDIGLFRFPKVYLAENRCTLNDGCFVFEDMGAIDGQAFSEEYIPGFSLDQVKKIVRGIADLHHYCLTSEDQTWKTKCDVPVDVIENFCSIMWGVASKLKTYDSDRLSDKMDKIQNHYTFDFIYEGRHGYKKHGLPAVLIHQDMNSTNILWTKKNGAKEISAYIDFQMITVGGICEDIIRVLSLGMSTEDRRAYTDCVLQEYHARLTTLFNGKPPYTLDQVREEYRRSFASVNNFTLFGISCYYGQCKEEKLPADVKHAKLTEYLNRANGIADDILAYCQ